MSSSMSSLSTRAVCTPGRWLGSGLMTGLAALAVLVTTTACDPQDIKDALTGHGKPPTGTDAAVQPSSDGGVATNPCAATLCPTGTRCEVQAVACLTKPCPETAVCVKDVPPPPVCPPVCKIVCQYGNVLDANGCATCACNPPPADPCITVKCSSGTHCEATPVMCIKAPCPPVVGCVADVPRVACGGFAGIACPGAGKCVDDPSDTCDPAKGGADCGGICSCLPIPCPGAAMFDGSPKICACVPTSTGGTGGASGGGGGGATGSGGTGGSGGTLKEGESCGGFRPANSPTCAAGLLCQEQAGSLCGAADAPGICVKIPATCPKQAPQPVCGCDGNTYASPCLATKALVGILDLGACK